MPELHDPAVLVLLLLPGEKVRSLLLNAISNLPPDPKGISSQETPRFTAELLSAGTLETIIRLRGQSAPVLVLQQAEDEDHGVRSGAPVGEEHPEVQANGQDLLAAVLAAAEEEEAAPAHPDYPTLEPLSPREMEILALLAQGASNQLLSKTLSISLNTVKTHLKNVTRKLNTSNREQTALVGKLVFYKNSSDWSDAS